MRSRTRIILLAVLVAGCSSSDGDSDNDAMQGPELCTPEATEALVSEADLSKMMDVLDEPSQSVMLTSIAKQCCPVCPEGSDPVGRPPNERTKACVTCAAAYSSGNPAELINSCAEKVCTPY